MQDHIQTLNQVFTQLEEAGLTLKESKCCFGLPRISYLGHVIDKNGLHPAPVKIEAISKARPPRNVKELRAFLGLIIYYHKFLPNLSLTRAPMYNILQQKTKWKWTEIHDETFKTSTLLVHFYPTKTLIVTEDASPYGLGAVLS